MKNLVVIPTYNEKDNIPEMVKSFKELDINTDILVVDDNSPDGTADVVKSLQQENPHLNLLLREKKNGLGRAYIAGFKWALERDYDLIVEMDADFSHRPVDLKNIIDGIAEDKAHDFFIGSRWVDGGGTMNWGIGRKFISQFGSLYSRLILGYPVKDWTGGFNFWKRNVLEGIGIDEIQSEGYSFQIELKYRAQKKGFKVKEMPIIFEERRAGQSKMSSKIVLEALYRVWSIRYGVDH